MKSYCLKCRKDTKNIKPKISNTSNGQYVVVKNQDLLKSKKQKEYQGIRTNLGIRTPLSKLLLLGDFLF